MRSRVRVSASAPKHEVHSRNGYGLLFFEYNGIIWGERKVYMKRLITVMLMVIIAVGLMGCAEKAEPQGTQSEQQDIEETGSYDLQTEMQDMSGYIETQKVLDINVAVISDFFASFNSTDYRLRGMVTEYGPDSNGNIGCKLLCDNRPVTVYFDDGETTENGEYIEIVGDLLTISNSDWEDAANISINSAHILERGESVHEQIEQEQ